MVPKINIGLTDEQRQGVIDLLNQDLADLYLLVIKTKKYHWDVVGPQFRTLHHLWEEQYEALTISIDAVAERIRALGGYPLGTAEAFLKNASLKEHSNDLPSAKEMVRRLMTDHEQVIRNLRDHSHKVEKDFNDPATQDFINGLIEEHEEMAWMLRSFIEGESFEPSGERASNSIGVSAGS
ncbi:MAG: Dps family protein [Spirulinaceae cyanobacterium]